MNYWWFLVPAAYLVGSIPTARLVGYVVGHNPTQEGSKNPGTTNVFRVAGYKAGIVVLLTDTAKGALPVLVAILVANRNIAAVCSMAAVIGHIFPLFARFKGGRGVATFGGGMVILNPIPGFSGLALWIVIYLITKLSSLASLLAVLAVLISTILIGRPAIEIWMALGMTILIIIRHKENIIRLIMGQEG